MLLRSFIALSVAAAVLGAPTVSRTRVFCRASGVEVAAATCDEEASDTSRALVRERCCEHRVQAPLGVAKSEVTSSGDDTLVAVAVDLPWFSQWAASVPPGWDAAPPSRPPLSATRILLI